MANTIAIASITKLYIMSGSFQEIPGITDINGPTITKNDVDVSNMSSTGYKDFRPAFLADAGTVAFDCQWNPTNSIHKLLIGRVASGSIVDTFRMTFSSGTNYDFSGSMMELAIKASNPADGILMGAGKIRLSGAVVLP